METLSTEQLSELEQYARAFAGPKKICLIMELPWVEMQSRFLDEGDPVYMAYNRGKEKRNMEINLRIIDMALAGSSAAQVITERLAEEQIAKEHDELQ
jgi:hypothetical protein